jgi:hypothetical protein
MDIIMVFITGIIYGLYAPVLNAGINSMADDPIFAVYSYVERAYVRLQAGDVLIRCLEEGNASPMKQLVEGLVLVGPQSLGVLREMRSEAAHRKSQVLDDLHQVFSDLEESVLTFGIVITNVNNSQAIIDLKSANFIEMMQEQGVLEEDSQAACLQILKDSRELITSLDTHVKLLEEIEHYIQDWLWGLAYQQARDGMKETGHPYNILAL